jgi:iron(III) transport system substrate-binding protein
VLVVGRWSGWLALAAAAVGLTACGGSGSDALTVYSGQHEQTMALLTADFTKRTGIDVKVRHNSEASLANQLLREGSASPADVFITENPPALTVVERKGLYAPVRPATLAKTPSQFNSPAGDWVAVSARSAVLVYDPDKLTSAQLPAELEALAGPQWRGKIGFAPAESDFQPLVTAVGKLHGAAAQHAWLEGMKRNGKRYDGNVAIVMAVDRGEISAGLIDHYYYYRTRDEVGASKLRARLHYFAPRDAGALVDVSGAAALKSSKHPEEAQQFLAYLVSKPAQEIIAGSESYEYPLGSGVRTKRDIKPFSELHPPDISAADLGDGRGALRALEQVGLL